VLSMKFMKALAIFTAVLLAAGAAARTLAAAADATTSATQPGTGTGTGSGPAAAPAFSPDTAYTLEEMLNYALLDEYTTEAAAAAVNAKFGEQTPFAELQALTAQRILLLKGLFESYGFAIPLNTAAENLKVPSSLQAAYSAGLKAETRKIQMYEAFLAQAGLPDSVRTAFEELLQGAKDARDIFEPLTAQNAQGDDNKNNGDRDDDDDKEDDEGGDD
jgi:hypothetical protein